MSAERISAPDIGQQLSFYCPQAIDIVNRLNEAGYEAYIVGGCIRDLLLGKDAKDFDVATSATPEEVKGLFKRSRIIGRRFQIVHVRDGRHLVEVTTFRAHHDKIDQQANQSAHSDTGMLLRDNVYGDLEDDARRRDFTVNALYFCPATNEIIDYCGGLHDLEERQLRVIGDPLTRYREDPVRMLRAARFMAKLGFELTPDCRAPIDEHGALLLQISPARLFDEVLKLFLGGYAQQSYQALQALDLFKFLFPATAESLASGQDYADKLVESTLYNTDERIKIGKHVTPAFLFAALLWPSVSRQKLAAEARGKHAHDALIEAARTAVQRQNEHTALPKRFSVPMREIWELQGRLHRKQGKRAIALHANPRFRAAYDFILLREQSGEDLDGLGQWWTEYQERNPVETPAPKSRRRPRRR
jgi:poly(A) polymerase